MKNQPENYDIFIRAMYKGIEKKYLQSEYNVRLYRCQLISKAEIDILETNLILVYSRAFLSFSKDKGRAINFLKKGNNQLTPVMFIVNAINLDEAFSSNAELNNIQFNDNIFKTGLIFFIVRRLFTLPRDGLFSWIGSLIYLVFTYFVIYPFYYRFCRTLRRA